MTQPVAIARWHDIARARDVAGLDALLADDVVFLSPVVRTPQPGKALTKAYLGAALDALLNETFHYVGEWIGPNSAVLEFVATIDGIEVDGADFIAWNGADQIVSVKVMIRPLKAIEVAPQRMAARLARA
jgi:ketosteroid isomerase-like protein